MQTLLTGQRSVSPQIPMPVDVMDESSRVVSVSGEAVQFVVASTNVNDAGSAAGTLVYFRLTNGGVLDSSGGGIGNHLDTSFAFGTGTALVTAQLKAFPWGEFENYMTTANTRLAMMTAITNQLTTNGDWVFNHRTGIGYGKKATTGATDTASYSYRSTVNTASSVTGGTSTRTTITPSLSSQTLVAANTGRYGLRVVHTAVDPTQFCWISTGTASSTSFFTKQQGSFEIALFDEGEWPYTGAWNLISDVASGTTQVFQLTT